LATELTFSLQSQVALVTGAAGALGRQMALTLAQAGAQVVLAGRTLETLQATAKAVNAQGGTAHCVRMDVSLKSSIVSALDEAQERAGIISIVVNNAGINRPKPALELTEDDWDVVLGTNLRGCFLVARESAQRLINAKTAGSIINVASVLALRGQKGVSAYMAAKAGLVHLTRSLALEWASYGIRVNALLPGYVTSDLTARFLESEQGRRLVRGIPQRRLAETAELSGPLLLLASSASSYMTGSLMVVDGGLIVSSL
jgi:NAD(P)-dependent dehydrogenase (short-subunit alcohol dehydrogenase family)